MLKSTFFLLFFLIIYPVLLYPLLLYIISFFFKENKLINLSYFPTITIVCAAYNEEKNIAQKIESFLNLNYPKDKIKMIVISDDSTDKTNDIVKSYTQKYSNIKLVIQKPRKGKVSAMNLIQPSITSDYVVSTDATSIFDKDAIINLVKIIESNKRIGFVAGNMKFPKRRKTSGEDTYFTIDSKIKYFESKIYSTITSNGVLYLIKRELFTKLPTVSPDDFERTLITIKKGFLAKFSLEAFVFEEVEEKAMLEFNRKIRIISRGWATVFRQKAILNPFKYPIPLFFIISHKIIKWLIGFFVLFIFFITFMLSNHTFFKILFLLELIILILGVLELYLQSKNKTWKISKFSGYFLSMNLASIIGFYKFITGKYSGVWETNRKG